MSKTRKLLVVLLSALCAVALFMSVGVIALAEGETPVNITGATTVESEFAGNGFTMQVNITTDATDLPGSGNLTYVGGTHNGVTYTRGGATAVVGALHGNGGGSIKLFFRNPADVTFTSGVSEEGDILTIGAGFAFSNTAGTSYIVEEAVVYEYDGSAWVETEAPSETPATISAVSTEANGGNPSYPIRVDVNMSAQSIGTTGSAVNAEEDQLAKITYTRGEMSVPVAAAQGWGSQMQLYFQSGNGLTLTEDTPERGDIFSFGEDFVFSSQDGSVTYILQGEVNYIYTGSVWIAGTELPAEATQIEWPNTFTAADWNSDTQLDMPSNLQSNNQGQLTYDPSMLSLVQITRGDSTFACSHIYEWGGNITFYFNSSGYTGKTPQDGDVLSVGAGLSVTNRNGIEYVNEEAVSWTYDADQAMWIKEGYEVEEPDYSDRTTLTIESVTDTDTVNGTAEDTVFFVNTDSANTTDFGDANYTATNILNYITFTFPSGTEVAPWYCRVNGSVARFFIRQESGSGNINAGQIPVGGILTIKPGFCILDTEAVKEEVSYIYTGSEWILGTELPEIDASFGYAETEVSGFEGNGFTMRVDVSTNAANLGAAGTNLNYGPGTHVNVTYARGSASSTVGSLQADGSNIRLFFKNPSADVTFANGVSEEGDILTLAAGFTFEDANGATYVVTETQSFRFDGGSWVKADANGEYPTLVTAQVSGVTTSTDGNSSNPIAVAVGTNISRDELGSYGNMGLQANQLAKATYTRGNVTVSAAFVHSNGSGGVMFWFKSTDGLTLVEDTPEPGDILTVSGEFRFVSNNSAYADRYYKFTGALSYVYDGVSWIAMREIPDRDYEGLTDLTISSVTTSGAESDAVFFINTNSSNTQNFGDANYDDTYTVLPYLSFVYPNGNIGDVWYARVNGSVIRLFIHEPGTQSNINLNTIPEGGVLTIRAGFGILATEALKQDVSYVYNGTAFVPLVAPDSSDDYTIATPNNTAVKVGEDLQIEVTDADSITAYYRYSVSNTDIATISPLGVLRGVSQGTVTVSVWYGDLEVKTVDIVVEPLEAEDITEFEIVSEINNFRIPVPSVDDESSDVNYFWQKVVVEGGYQLMGMYTLESGTEINVAITEDEIEDIDFTVTGTHQLTVTDDLSGRTATISVTIYDYVEVGTFSSLGVSGYDVDDSRNQGGTWNGHMMVGMNQYSTNTRNMTGSTTIEQTILKDIASYIVYERADGTVYQNTTENSPISVWQVSTNILVMIRPNGYTGTKGYGVDAETGEGIPIYNLNDTITFKKGMPIYLYVGNSTNTSGYYVVEGRLAEDVTYYCYEDNGTSSLWQLYIEYTDFTVSETMEIEVNTAVPVGAVRVPSNATTGTFTYQSSDPSVVTINASGTMVGISAGTATITITLSGGRDAEGELLPDIIKTVTVTVVRGIQSVRGSIEVVQGSTLDLSQFSITVTYTDGSTEEIPLNDEKVVLQDIDTSTLGEQTYNVLVTVNGTDARGTLTVNVVEEGNETPPPGEEERGGCSSAAGAATLGIGAAVLLGAGALLLVRRKRQK